MQIFIDFDDTIFNTKKFSADFRKLFDDHGVCEDIFKDLYYDYPEKEKDGKLRKYNLENHLNRIRRECKLDTTQLRASINEFIKDTSNYVFSDSVSFLEIFKKEELFLVSYGDTPFQKRKIENSGVTDYFKKVIITDFMKSDAIGKLLRDGKAYFIEDRVEQLEDVKKNIKTVETIFIKRKEGRYQDEKSGYCDWQVRSLNEALEIIN